jgi:O-antigen/teichoic acid export membrane protein
VRLGSVALWGGFVQVMLWVQLGAMVVGWGNKEFLLRAFSRRPGAMAGLWQSAFVTRSLLLAPVAFALVLILVRWHATGTVTTAAAVCWLLGLFLYQSFDVLVVYRRAFGWAMAVEAAATAGMAAFILLRQGRLAVGDLAVLLALATLGKAGAMLIRFRHDIRLAAVGLRLWPAFWREALVFFLLGFSGMLHSRIDLYSVGALLPPSDVGIYQVYTGFLLYFQALAAFMLTPFLPALFRAGGTTLQKISQQMFVFALIVVFPVILTIDFILRFLYKINLSYEFLILGGLYVIPLYYYITIIYELYKEQLQKIVLFVNIAGIIAKLLLNLILLPKIGAIGALLSSTIVVWFVFVFYVRQRRRLVSARP